MYVLSCSNPKSTLNVFVASSNRSLNTFETERYEQEQHVGSSNSSETSSMSCNKTNLLKASNLFLYAIIQTPATITY